MKSTKTWGVLDDQDGNLSFLIETNGTDEIDTSEPGEHTVTYDVTDFSEMLLYKSPRSYRSQ